MVTRRSFLRGVARGGAAVAVRPSPALAARPERDRGTELLDAWVQDYSKPHRPRGVRLSFDADPATTRAVTWLTTGDPGASIVEYAFVAAGATSPGRGTLDRSSVGSRAAAPFGFGEADRAEHEALLDPYRSPGPARPGEEQVYVHRARVEGIPAGATIAYRVGDGHRWSPVFHTTTAPTDSFRFTHLGDHGLSVGSRRNTAAILERRPDWHLIAGDISYANGDQRLWDVWAEQVQPLGAAVPIMAAPGNHEAKDFMGETYRARFTHPNAGKPWYSIDIGKVHLVSTTAGAFFGDHEVIRELVTEELLFLEQDLAVAHARRAAGEIDFIVVAQHFPTYTNHETRGPFSPQLVVAEEHVLQRYQVDLLLVGHDHMYQRSHPMAYGTPTPGGIGGYVQVIAGGGGSSLYEFADEGTDWLAAKARRLGFVEYAVSDGLIEATAYGYPDGYDDSTVDDDVNAVDPNLEPDIIDTFTIERRSTLGAAPPVARAAAEVLAGVPEVNGIVVRNHREDCTRHQH